MLQGKLVIVFALVHPKQSKVKLLVRVGLFLFPSRGIMIGLLSSMAGLYKFYK